MKLSTASALTTASAIATAAFSAQAAIVVNGDFETPPGAVAGSTPPGWSITALADIGVYNGFDYGPCCGVHGAALADQFVSFGPGNQDNSGVLSQTTLALAAGRYLLTYQVGAFGGGAQSLNASVLGGLGTPSQTVTATADNNIDTTFHTYTLAFTSTGAPVTLDFRAASGGVGDNVDVLLDNVSISAAVPEAATWAMMLIGFAAVGVALRRRLADVTA